MKPQSRATALSGSEVRSSCEVAPLSLYLRPNLAKLMPIRPSKSAVKELRLILQARAASRVVTRRLPSSTSRIATSIRP